MNILDYVYLYTIHGCVSVILSDFGSRHLIQGYKNFTTLLIYENIVRSQAKIYTENSIFFIDCNVKYENPNLIILFFKTTFCYQISGIKVPDREDEVIPLF